MSKVVMASEEMKNEVMNIFDQGFIGNIDRIVFKVEHDDRRPSYEGIVTYDDNALMNEYFKDAKVVCGLQIDNLSDGGSAFVAITQGILDMWEVNDQDVINACMENLKNEDYDFRTLLGLLAEIKPEVGKFAQENSDGNDEMIYTLTNSKGVYGARMILSEDILEMITNTVGDFYILPSSVHEVLIMPKKSGMNCEDLEYMVKEVNDTQVEERDLFSYHVATVA